jgi:hypothetical protein
LYKNILSGYVNKKQKIKLQPLFELGNILDRVQIRISKINNNKHSVLDDEYWDDFFVYKKYDEDLKLIFDNVEKTHINEYHLYGNEISLSDYANISLSDVYSIQKIQKHSCDYHKDKKIGLDYINEEYNNYHIYYTTQCDISAYKSVKTNTYWYELTSDVIYTLNNSVPNNEIEQKFNKVKNFDKIKRFITDDSTMGFGNITLDI